MPRRAKPSCGLCEGLWVRAEGEMLCGRNDANDDEQLEMAAVLFIYLFIFNFLKVTID